MSNEFDDEGGGGYPMSTATKSDIPTFAGYRSGDACPYCHEGTLNHKRYRDVLKCNKCRFYITRKGDRQYGHSYNPDNGEDLNSIIGWLNPNDRPNDTNNPEDTGDGYEPPQSNNTWMMMLAMALPLIIAMMQ